MSDESKDKGGLTEDQKEIVREIVKQAKGLGVDPRFAIALANLESTFQHVPADDKSSTAFGPFQVNKATAEANGVDYKAMQDDRNLAIRAGLLNIARHASNPDLGGDPMRIAAAHRYGENSDFAKTGDPKGIDPTLRQYLVDVTKHFPESTLPESVYTKVEKASAEPGASEEQKEPKPFVEQQTTPARVPRLPAGIAGATHGAELGAGAGLTAGGFRLKYDIAQLIAQYPDAMAAFKSGKSPGEVINIALKHLSPSEKLPPATGPLEGTPAGGKMTQNWIKSQDAPGAYADVGLQARDLKEAHEMKRAAMAAEDKIKSIAPEFGAVPERGGLFLSQSAGRGPSPRFGGTPTTPIPAAVPESPSVVGALTNAAKHYLPYAKWPVLGGLTGFNVAQGAADVYNRYKEDKPWQAGLSALGTAAGTAAPFLAGEAALGATGLGALIPAYLYMKDNPEQLEKAMNTPEPKKAFRNRGFGLD